MDYKTSWRTYYQLSKPGIIYGNLLTATAGYIFASRWHIQLVTMTGLLAGMAVVIASACVVNNIIDRPLDARMQRTKRRAVASGQLPVRQAIIFAALLLVGGSLLLALTQVGLVLVLIAIAYLDYTVFYAWGKRHSVHGTLIGCISGAMPIVAGYVAAVQHLDIGAILLFGLMVCWQMAHFFGIALYRYDDYKAAGLPVMPVARGVASASYQALGYMVLFIVMVISLDILGYLHTGAALVIIAAAIYWFMRSTLSYRELAFRAWGRQVFLTSLLVILATSFGLMASPLL